eukprot:1159644-Pelagomonas_calceolata.AAC.1
MGHLMVGLGQFKNNRDGGTSCELSYTLHLQKKCRGHRKAQSRIQGSAYEVWSISSKTVVWNWSPQNPGAEYPEDSNAA